MTTRKPKYTYEKRRSCCVITSYSIHYTKLYDEEVKSKLPKRSAYQAISNMISGKYTAGTIKQMRNNFV